jgi:AraC-like DNA-binding protein
VKDEKNMKLSFVKPRRELQPYIESLWIFESPSGLPATDTSIAAPNGCCKLTFPLDNSLISVADGVTEISSPQRLYFVGNRNSATFLQSSSHKTGCIGIEFFPHGAFPIFGIPMGDLFNALWGADVLFGKWARETQEILNNLQSANEKVVFLQDRLVLLLRKNCCTNELVTYCVQALKSADGRVSIQDLAQTTGYSRRYLSLLFKQHVGLSPKVLAGIFRFQRFYKKWAEGQSFDLLKGDLYEHYYDQAHFSKEFKKMTGHAPREFAREISNEFGRRLSRR